MEKLEELAQTIVDIVISHVEGEDFDVNFYQAIEDVKNKLEEEK